MSDADGKQMGSPAMIVVICVALVLCICLAGYIQYWCRRGYERQENTAQQIPQLFAQMQPHTKARRQLLPTINDLNVKLPVIEYNMWKKIHSGESALQENMKIIRGSDCSDETYPRLPVKALTTCSPSCHCQLAKEISEPAVPERSDALDAVGHPDDVCVICLDNLKGKDIVREIGCGHVFHALCIDEWLTRRRPYCPVCKSQYGKFISSSIV